MATSASGKGALNQPAYPVDVVESEDESSIDRELNAQNGLPRVTVAIDESDLEAAGDEEDAHNDWADVDSLYEDTLEEMGDEHLFHGGKHSQHFEKGTAAKNRLQSQTRAVSKRL